MSNSIYDGPTVFESAMTEERRLGKLIEDMKQRRKAALRRAMLYRHSSMLEAERLATKAEPFQTQQLS